MSNFDVVIIGSGPGGYVSAVRCAQLGLKTAIIEKYSTLGGTCLNVGCIPSKAWLDSSEKYHELKNHFGDHGIESTGVKLNFNKMRTRVEKVVSQTCDGIDYLMKKNKITVFQGIGSFIDKNTIEINGKKKETIIGKNIIIATGSKPTSLPGLTIDKKQVITSTEALYLKERPKHMVVIGGGVIGLELGSVYKRLGSEVTVVEYADKITSIMDDTLSKELLKSLKKLGIKFYLGHAVQEVKTLKTKITVIAKKNGSEEEIKIDADTCLVSVGRRAFTDKLNVENAGVEIDERGFVKTNDHLQTNVDNIYAIGDVTYGPMLAHKAEEDGVFVAELLAGQKPHLNYDLVPSVIYTWPEVASVGKTEQQLKSEGIAYKSGSFPFKASGRARASNESDGLIKVLADKTTDEILGVHMIGPRAADMIAEAVVAMEYKASAEDIGMICHPHPTYTEALKEACLAATENRAIHI